MSHKMRACDQQTSVGDISYNGIKREDKKYEWMNDIIINMQGKKDFL